MLVLVLENFVRAKLRKKLLIYHNKSNRQTRRSEDTLSIENEDDLVLLLGSVVAIPADPEYQPRRA